MTGDRVKREQNAVLSREGFKNNCGVLRHARSDEVWSHALQQLLDHDAALRQQHDRYDAALRGLVEQFDAYRNGYLGKGVWKDRVDLPEDLDRARQALRKSNGKTA